MSDFTHVHVCGYMYIQGIFESCLDLNSLAITFVRDGMAGLVSPVFESHFHLCCDPS